ncbi:MAG: hypothetical protein ABI787_08670 [Spartobacteria bacterium]
MKISSPINPALPRARHNDHAGQNLQSFPSPDYQFHTPTMDAASVSEQSPAVGSAELRAFRQLSNSYAGEESHRGYLIEMLVFALVVGVIIWPLVSLVIVMAQTAGG